MKPLIHLLNDKSERTQLSKLPYYYGIAQLKRSQNVSIKNKVRI